MFSQVLRMVSATFLLGSFFLVESVTAFGVVPDIIPVGGSDIRIVIFGVLDAVINILGLFAGVAVIIAGIRLVLCQGEETEKDAAKKTVMYAIAGLILILFAKALVVFVMSLG